MPARRLAVAVVLLACLAGAGSAWAQRVPIPPRPDRLVNDYAGVLSAAEREALERKLVAYDDSTSTQIAVAILPTLGGADPGDFATELGRAWGVGQAGADNGAVVLVSVEEREVFIATGFGLEAVVPDVVAGRIVRNVIVPRFREGRFYAGLDEATDAIMAAAAGEFSVADRAPSGGGEPVDAVLLFIVILIAVLVVSSLLSRGGRGGGGWGRGPGIVVLPGGFSGRSGGFGGGGFGGGGFGGFGGGGFGGGGAGGGW